MPAPKGNNYAKGNNGGRPRKFSNVEDMQKAIDDYFQKCDEKVVKKYSKAADDYIDVPSPTPYTIEGLAVALGVDRRTLLNYENEKGYEEFFLTIKEAKDKVLQNLSERALLGDSVPSTSIFLLKNNYGYKDKTEQEITGKDGKDLIQPITVIRTPEQADKIKNE